MKTKADTYYLLYIGDKFIIDSFATLQAALDYGKNYKRIDAECRGDPIKIEKVHIIYETTIVYDGAKPTKPVMFHLDPPIDPNYV